MNIANRIDQPGTDEAAWRRWPTLASLPQLEMSDWRSVAVVAAHPDDEVLGAGGTMAMLAAAGLRLRLIVVTDGEASHPGIPPAVTARIRIAEQTAALGLLGAGDVEVIRLGLPDTGLTAREAELTTMLREHCDEFDACLTPWEEDAHADHEAAGRATLRARPDAIRYPVWMWHWAEPADGMVPWQQACQVPLTAAATAQKRAAIGAFTSQLTGRPSGGPVVAPGVLAHFTRPQEVFIR